MKRHADWFAWVLQYAVGFVVGGFIAFAITHKGFQLRSNGLITEYVFTFIGGTALIWAAMASYYGDRLWLASSHRVIPPDDIPSSNTSRVLSIITGSLGVALVLKSVLYNSGVLV